MLFHRSAPGTCLGVAALFACLLALGCSSKPTDESDAVSADRPGDSAASATQESSDTPAFQFGDLLEPFDPPSLESLEASVQWEPRPVMTTMQRMRQLKAKEPAPELTVSEALQLRNDSPEANRKIRAALGRLAPEDGSTVDYEATVVRHVNGDLKSTNPLLASSVTEFDYHGLTAIGLVTFDQKFEWFGLAEYIESWHTSDDRLYDKFVLRDDLYWSDGKPVTAHDFEYTFKTIMTKAVTVPAVRQGTDELKAVKAYDDHTLVVFHKESLPTSTENLQFYVLPQHIYEKTIPEDPTMSRSAAHSRLEDNPVVAGPYGLSKRVRGQEFVLSRREDYYERDGKQLRDKPYIKQVRSKIIEDFNTALLALKAGDLDQMELRPEQWVTQTNNDSFYRENTKVSDTEWTEFHFVWNQKSPFFRDPKVRWAMTYAVDYEELLQTVCYGLYEQCRGNYHPTSWMFPQDAPEIVEQDLDKAQQLLADAGWEDTDGDGVLDKQINGRRRKFEFTLLTFTTDSGIKTATLMKECLDLLGIICNVKPTEFTVLVQKSRDKEFDALMGGWGSGTDPYTNKNVFGTGEGRNYGSYSNPEVDRLFEEGMREFDRAKRAEIYGEIHKLLWQDQPYTWLFYRNSFYGFNKALQGYNFSPRGPFSYSPGFESVFVPAAAP